LNFTDLGAAPPEEFVNRADRRDFPEFQAVIDELINEGITVCGGHRNNWLKSAVAA